MRIRCYNIRFDTDGKRVNLPSSVEIEMPENSSAEEIAENGADKISDKTGWCVESFNWEVILA